MWRSRALLLSTRGRHTRPWPRQWRGVNEGRARMLSRLWRDECARSARVTRERRAVTAHRSRVRPTTVGQELMVEQRLSLHVLDINPATGREWSTNSRPNRASARYTRAFPARMSRLWRDLSSPRPAAHSRGSRGQRFRSQIDKGKARVLSDQRSDSCWVNNPKTTGH